MRLRPGELQQRLRRDLVPVYLISGDEPLQLGEAADAVRAAALAAGYTTREVLDVGPGFDWNRLTAEANSLSLFGDRKLIDLRLPGGSPGKDGGAVLQAYCAAPPTDTLLLVTCAKLDRRQLATRWFKAIETAGAAVQVWPLEGTQLTAWTGQRLRAAGLEPAPEVAEMLAARVEGNLLAARQEIEKLLLLYGPGPIGVEQLAAAVADSARFDVFNLIDSALRGEAARCLRILSGLRGEGVAAPVVLWAASRELRTLLPLTRDVHGGATPDRAMTRARVWEKRKPVFRAALARLDPDRVLALLVRCQGIDTIIKGAGVDDPWRSLEQLLLVLAGTPTVAAAPE